MPSDRESVAIVGGGTMGVGLLYVFAAAGFDMTLVEPDAQRAEEVSKRLAEAAQNGVSRGKLDAAQAEAITRGYRHLIEAAALPEGQSLVIESVPERLDLKRRVLSEIAARRPQIIATNTSALSVDALADAVTDASRFLGMHFFNPVWSLHLVEIVRGKATSDVTLSAAHGYAEAIGKSAITVTDTLSVSALGGITDYTHLAELAGFGAIGYHGLLITPEFGPRVRLAAVFTSIEDLPSTATDEHAWIEDFCRECVKCVRQCPPQAIGIQRQQGVERAPA